MTNLEELMEHCIKIARSTVEAGDENLPQWVLQTKDGGIHIMITPWGTLEEKRNAQLAVIFHMKEIEAVRFVFICEGWCVRVLADSKEDALAGPLPSEHPDRIEVLMIYGEEDEQLMLGKKLPRTGIHRNFPILRPENKLGDATTIEEQGGTAEGRFVDIFGKLDKLKEMIRKKSH